MYWKRFQMLHLPLLYWESALCQAHGDKLVPKPQYKENNTCEGKKQDNRLTHFCLFTFFD